jgi:hypothetical protein
LQATADGEVLLRMNVDEGRGLLSRPFSFGAVAALVMLFIPTAATAGWHNHSGQMVILGGVAMHRNIKSQGSTEELEAQLVLVPNRGCGHETLDQRECHFTDCNGDHAMLGRGRGNGGLRSLWRWFGLFKCWAQIKNLRAPVAKRPPPRTFIAYNGQLLGTLSKRQW